MRKRKKKSDEEQEEEEPKQSSPGFCKHGFVFEQVLNGLYAQGETEDLVPEYNVRGKTYVPMKRAPWPLAEKAINYGSLSDLWKETRQFIYNHLFLPEEPLYDVLTSWTLATWVTEVWTVVPYIFFFGPPATGKTRGLEVLQRLTYRGMLASNLSPAVMYHICHLYHPTLFLDETAIYTYEGKTEVVHLLNSGYRRGQPAMRMKGKGADMAPAFFDVFGFKSLAGTKTLARTLESRCLMIMMLKARRKVKLSINENKATEIRGKLLQLRLNTLAASDVSVISDVFLKDTPKLDVNDGRLIELFSPLLSIANDGREAILKYAHEVYDRRQSEERASEEAEIIAILSNPELNMRRNIVFTKDLTEMFNANRLEKDQWKSKSIGWIMRRLGFSQRRTGQGRGWFVNPERLSYLQQGYGIKSTLSPSKTSRTPQTSDKQPVMKECFFCGKPIWTQDWKTDEFTNNKPAHKHCYDEQKAKLRKASGSVR